MPFLRRMRLRRCSSSEIVRPGQLAILLLQVIERPGSPHFGLVVVAELPFAVFRQLDERGGIDAGCGTEPSLPGVRRFLPAALPLHQSCQAGEKLGAVVRVGGEFEGAAIGGFGKVVASLTVIRDAERNPVGGRQPDLLGRVGLAAEGGVQMIRQRPSRRCPRGCGRRRAARANSPERR